jgi:putative colanic acid biosynthesis UDP-glucose lipid carrier transferase
MSSSGTVFFRQERVSYNGKSFIMLKFRSMSINVEKNTGPTWAKAGENRATPFGQFLRKTSFCRTI